MANDAVPKPRIALGIATALGLGYMPIAPGTWGSLLGVLFACVAVFSSQGDPVDFAAKELALILAVSLAGVWAAERVGIYLGKKDPQLVVVDEVAGQLIAYLGLASSSAFAVSWKYLLLGFILFRAFDIWKPFPARQAESLPGGLGIMADDWIAGGYAAVALWLAGHWGL